MLAVSHDELVAIIGAIGILVAAAVPVLVTMVVSLSRGRKETTRGFDRVENHLPPNGGRLYEMVESTSETVGRIRDQLESNTNELLSLHHKADRAIALAEGSDRKLEGHIKESGPLKEFVQVLMARGDAAAQGKGGDGS